MTQNTQRKCNRLPKILYYTACSTSTKKRVIYNGYFTEVAMWSSSQVASILLTIVQQLCSFLTSACVCVHNMTDYLTWRIIHSDVRLSARSDLNYSQSRSIPSLSLSLPVVSDSANYNKGKACPEYCFLLSLTSMGIQQHSYTGTIYTLWGTHWLTSYIMQQPAVQQRNVCCVRVLHSCDGSNKNSAALQT